MNNEATVKVKVKLEGFEKAKRQIVMLGTEIDRLRFIVSSLSDALNDLSLNVPTEDGGDTNAE